MKITRDEACEIAEQWWSVMTWSDPGVCMYAFGSTGCVQSEEHRADILDYIDTDCMPAADSNDDPEADKEQLATLRKYIAKARVEECRKGV